MVLGASRAVLASAVLASTLSTATQTISSLGGLSSTAAFGAFGVRLASGTTLTIAGEAAGFLVESLQISEQVGQRNTASFVLPNRSTRPGRGEPIQIYWGTILRFAGQIDSIEETIYEGTDVLELTIGCVDYNFLADRLRVAASYENQTSGAIFANLVDAYLGPEGITVGTVESGLTIEAATFAYETVTEAFRKLAGVNPGFVFNIDYLKRAHFHARTTVVAPFSITGTHGQVRNLRVKRDRANYRNVQLIGGGRAVSSDQVEEFVGDGAVRTFTVGLKIAEEPSITLNASPQTVGIKGIETGFDWYWNKDDATITQDVGGTTLTGSDALEVTYKGFFPVFIQTQNTTEILARQAVEGGTGQYVSFIKDESIDNLATGGQIAEGELARYGELPTTLTFDVDPETIPLVHQASAGMLLPMTIELHGVDDDFLIQRLSARDRGGEQLVYSLECVDGELRETSTEFFQKILNKQDAIRLGENVVFTAARSQLDSTTLADSTSYTTSTAICEVGVSDVGFCELSG